MQMSSAEYKAKLFSTSVLIIFSIYVVLPNVLSAPVRRDKDDSAFRGTRCLLQTDCLVNQRCVWKTIENQLTGFCQIIKGVVQNEPFHLRPRRQIQDGYAYQYGDNINKGIDYQFISHNYQPSNIVGNNAYNLYDFGNTAMQPPVGYYNGGASHYHAVETGVKSPAQFETLLTEDNTADYMNYDNHYDVNLVHSQGVNSNIDHGVANDHGKSISEIHKHGPSPKANGIEMDVGTRDRVAHDPIELEAVAMRAIGHHHRQDELEYQDSSGRQEYLNYESENNIEHYHNPYEEYIDPHNDPLLYYK